MKKILHSFLTICLIQSAFSQSVFSEERFYALVIQNHPLAKQADLEIQYGEKSVLKARGGFDPKVYNQLNQKYFAGSQYYSFLNAGLKVPTWFGIELKSGFEANQGDFLNPEEKTPYGGLWYGGISMNVGQGLLIDQRRAELKKAKIYQQSTFFEQKLQLNELMYEAGYAYWNWFLAYHSTEVLREAFDLANQRFDAVKRAAFLGDRPNVDTLEARIQVQNRDALYRNYQTDFQGTGFKLATFLWDENSAPLELDSLTRPHAYDSIPWQAAFILLNEDIDSALLNHPYLSITNYKIESLKVDSRLKQEALKPQLNVQYNLINEPVNYNPLTNLSINNYKWALSFEMPVLLRKERGDYAIAKLKIQDEQYNLDNNRAYLEFKIRNASAEYQNALNQVDIYQKTADDSYQLLEAERTMFSIGESSLFLINARETAYIQAKLKLIEVLVKSQQALLSLKYALAQLV
jgi:outer membrane protein TolC